MPVGVFEISGKKVVGLRLKAVLTRQEFAEKGGMSVGGLRRIEGEDRTTIQVETLRALAKGAGYSPERFLELVDGVAKVVEEPGDDAIAEDLPEWAQKYNTLAEAMDALKRAWVDPDVKKAAKKRGA